MLPCPFWKIEKRKEMAKLYHLLPWWVLITLDSELIINPGFCGDCFSYEVSAWNLYSTSAWKRKSQMQKSNKVIREGGCACVYRFIYPAGFILIHTWIFVYLCQNCWPLNWECFLAQNQIALIYYFLMYLFIYSVQTLILLLIVSSTLKLGKILFS